MKESSLAKGGAALTRFERPLSVAEAARLLATGDWALLAGGTDLYPAHVGRNVTRPLLDLSDPHQRRPFQTAAVQPGGATSTAACRCAT